MKAILFDLDGVFYQGKTLIARASFIAAQIKEHDIPHLLITNTSSRPRSALIGKFRPTDLEQNIKPDVVFDSINDLPK